MGMPANLAACGICLEAEEDKKKGLFGVQEEQGARWTGHGGGKPLRKHTEAPSILPPGCLSREVALKGRTGSMGDSCTSAAMAAGSQPAAPHTPLSMTETSAQEVRGSPRTRAHAPPSRKWTLGECAACSGHGPACSSCTPACMREPLPPLTQLFQLGRHRLGTQGQGGAGRSLGRWRS